MEKAIQLLSSEEAQKTFHSAYTTFTQVSAERHLQAIEPSARGSAIAKLSAVAARCGSIGLAQIAASLQSHAKFDKIIAMIDEMVALLRREEKDDIAHRDRCESAMRNQHGDAMDIHFEMDKAHLSLEQLGDEETLQARQLEALSDEVEAAEADIAKRREARAEEEKAFQKALKDDADAVEILGQATEMLTEFYKSNKLPVALAQAPEYAADPDKAPETAFEGGDYKGAKSESGGVISILQLLKEDLELQMSTARKEDAENQAKYEEDLEKLRRVHDARLAAKINSEKDLAELRGLIAAKEGRLDQGQLDLAASRGLGEALEKDCAWVKTHFDSRRTKRQREIDGLQDAKTILAGASDEGAA